MRTITPEELVWRDRLRDHPELRKFVQPRLTAYIPHRPHPKQQAFLMLNCREAFFGGSAGGGKSDALLMAALQYVDVPGYSALIVRKTIEDAKKPGAALSRARMWLTGTDAVYVSSEHRFYFPSGAVLSFGGLSNPGDAYKYQSAEFQFLGFDELTHFYESDFEYVCSRLRRPKCEEHGDRPERTCRNCLEYAQLSQVPLRIRTASNPGGIGHIWVKKRYQIEKIPGEYTPGGRPMYRGTHPTRPHLPSFIEDNPTLDVEDYINQLTSIEDPVTREQLLSGDWGITEEGRFKPSWVRRYQDTGSWFELIGGKTWKESELQTFLIVDPAASKLATPGKIQLTKKLASYTAVGVFSFTRDFDLLVRRMYRHQKEVPETKHLIRQTLNEFPSCSFVGMELSTMSTHLFQLLQGEGFNMRAFSPRTGDKIARSVDVANRMEHGKVYFPEKMSKWLTEFEEEIFTWTGHQIETDDQVDLLSYAGMHVSHIAPKQGSTGPRSFKF